METKTDMKMIDRLEALGFKAAVEKTRKLAPMRKKLMIAYEHYRYVRPDKINVFNEKLYKETYNWDKMGGRHTLSFTPISDYPAAPPHEVLDALEAANAHECFDSYEVAYIKKVKDPILFGRIQGCEDRFFIGQWDDDISIDQILKENEG